MSYRRKTFRVELDTKGGFLRRGRALPCTVVDLSERGMRVKAGDRILIGESLPLEFSLPKGRWVRCTVEVVYVTSSHFGARITGIAPDHEAVLRDSIEDLCDCHYLRQ